MTDICLVNLHSADDRLQDDWREYVDQHSKGTIFHTPEFVQVYRQSTYYCPMAMAACDDRGNILGLLVAAQVQTLPTPLQRISSRSLLHAEPLCEDSNSGREALTLLLQEHDRLVHDQVLFPEVRPIFELGSEKETFINCGYNHHSYLNYVVDLQQSLKALWRQLGKSCRNKIRRSVRRGVEIREVTSGQGVDILYRFLELSYGRARVPLADKSLFSAALEQLKRRNFVRISVAYYHGDPVAAGILLTCKGVAYAWYGGSERIHGIAPFDCLTWDEICWAHTSGHKLYDFGGAGWPDERYGPRDFKAKFGGSLVDYGRFRKVFSPWRMAVAKTAYSVGRRLVSPN